jgi:hypothetical protein
MMIHGKVWTYHTGRDSFQSIRYKNLIDRKESLPADEVVMPH